MALKIQSTTSICCACCIDLFTGFLSHRGLWLQASFRTTKKARNLPCFFKAVREVMHIAVLTSEDGKGKERKTSYSRLVSSARGSFCVPWVAEGALEWPSWHRCFCQFSSLWPPRPQPPKSDLLRKCSLPSTESQSVPLQKCLPWCLCEVSGIGSLSGTWVWNLCPAHGRYVPDGNTFLHNPLHLNL